MSFFKRMIGLFREEIDEEVEQPAKPAFYEETMSPRMDEQARPPLFHERLPDVQEMKAKITYRYPSREWQPSREEAEPQRPRRERRLEKQESQSSSLEKEKQYQHVREDEPVYKQPAKPALAYKSSPRPFKPTEIPSPIYGFNKRPVNNGPYSQERDDEAEPLLTAAEKAGEPPSTAAEKEEVVLASSKPCAEEGSALIQDDSFKESEAYAVAEEVTRASADDVRREERRFVPADAIEDEESLTPVTVFTEEKVKVVPADEVEKEEPLPKWPKEEPLLLFKPEEKKKAFDVEAVPSFTAEEEAAAAETVHEEKSPAEVLYPEKSAASIKVDEKPAPPTNPSGKLPEERSRRKRQTPFNVIMSKQDRELWKKRNETSAALPEQPVPLAAEAPTGEAKPETAPAEPAVQAVPAEETAAVKPDYYVFPHAAYLSPPVVKEMSQELVDAQSNMLNETFKNFNVKASVVNVTVGPSVTRFEVEPERGVKVSKITNLTDDIKRSLAARNIRIEAPIPGTQVIGIEVPNKESRPVQISEITSSSAFKENLSPLTSALGLDISGEPVVLDLKKMPHGLIAGATGSGKSVCINSILVSLLYKAAPHELKLMLIDPKMVELAPYNGIPHLVSPVITDVKAATAALKWAVEEMERRYELFVHSGVRDITKYNDKAAAYGRKSEHLPYIVIIIDELADLMMMSPAEVEEAICRIAQKARACGIHLIVATQRPSVDVITGLIKANIPTRIAFSVSSQVDSRTIIDTGGAEKLLGRGDMLFLNNGASEAVRLQGTFVSDDEIDTVVAHVRKEQGPNYLFEQEELLQKAAVSETEDELFPEACEFIVQQGGASTSLLQRHFKIGYNRAARLIEMMEAQGFVSGQRAGRPREVLITEEGLHALNEPGTN